MPKKVPSPAEIEQAVYAERQQRFAQRSRTGWDQTLEAEVADLILRRLRGENINIGLDARVKAALAAEGRKGLVLTGNDPDLRIGVGDRDVSGNGIVWPDGQTEGAFDPYICLARVDEIRRERGSYETPRLMVQELAVELGVPTDDRNTGRLTTVLYKLHDERKVIHDEDDRWRAAAVESDQLIDRLAQAHDVPRLSDDELAHLRAYLEDPRRLPELQRDPAGRDHRRKLREILNYNDEVRRSVGDGKKPNALADPEAAGAEANGEQRANKQAQPAALRAAGSYEWVCKERPDLVPKPPQRYDKRQWNYICENKCPAYTDDEDNSLPVPAFETWKRQVRAGCHDPRDPKATPRANRPHGKSVVSTHQI